MEFFTIANGISVHVWDTRDEKAPGQAVSENCLVLLHGYLETMYIYNELIDALKPHFRIITLDLPGHGLTDSAPAGPDGARINSLAFQAQVVAGVMDRCGVQKAVIAGHSMGGYVTLRFLHDFPDRAERGILLHSHPYPDVPEKADDRAREKVLIREGKLQALANGKWRTVSNQGQKIPQITKENQPQVHSQPADEPRQQSSAKYHTIKAGDTLYGIAKKYKTTIDKLCQLNGITKKTVLRAGRKLRVK